jgi:hypothetical protein
MISTPNYTISKINLKEKLKLKVSSEFQNRINYLHAKIKGVEWSGALFHEIKNGSLLDFDVNNHESIAGVEIELKHFELCDIGSAAYTEYDITQESLFDLYDKNPELIDYELSFLHSHHSMATNPSGTDLAHLRDSTETNQWFLSVIVNHDMKWKALLATRKTITIPAHKLPINTKDYNGNAIKSSRIVQESNEVVVYETELDIVFEENGELVLLIEELYKKKAAKAKSYNKSFNMGAKPIDLWKDNPAFGESNYHKIDYSKFDNPLKRGYQAELFNDDIPVDINQRLVSDFISVLLDCELKDKSQFDFALRDLTKLPVKSQKEEIEIALDCMPDLFYNISKANLKTASSAFQKHLSDLLPIPYRSSLTRIIIGVYEKLAEVYITEDLEFGNDIPEFNL